MRRLHGYETARAYPTALGIVESNGILEPKVLGHCSHPRIVQQ